MEDFQDKVAELRAKFTENVREDFHPKDIARAHEDDHWLQRFLIHHDCDVNDALTMLLETCEWRKTNKVNEISEATINLDYLKDGSLFVHNRDKDGKSLVIFKCSHHVKGQRDMEELKKIVIYWFERVERQDKGEQITIFFDMADTGLSNMDLDYTKYLITLCKLYYPHMLNYILIFEMPFILNAAFKVIKSWLPAKAVQKIKFVNKNNLNEYVDSDQALKSWGGTDPYVFTFEPEQQQTTMNNNVEWGAGGDENRKKVHFAVSPLSGLVSLGSGEDSRIKAPDAIVFNDDGNELSGTLTIKNVSESSICFKIKTTAPEKFRVRPSTGTLAEGKRIVINVCALSGRLNSATIAKDKFVVLTLPFESEEMLNVPEVWKSPESRKLMREHKVRCRLNSISPTTASQVNGNPGPQLPQSSNVEQKMSQLLVTMNHVNERFTELEGSLRILKLLNLVTAGIAIFFFVLYFYNDHPDNTGEASGTCAILP